MQTGIENNKINKAIETAIKSLGTIIDVNTVVGKPIKTENGDYVVPISKVTIGVLAGGGEYGKVVFDTKDQALRRAEELNSGRRSEAKE